ncbi:MAG: FecR domain-containing protein [Fidelibacterota bacterium]|nr:MAG: FecR domain-containing protein [Candidatus Neomarinimicrobiota bacterium]
MSEPSDWSMLTRYLAGDCTDQEQLQLEAWMAADPENRMLVEQMQVIWEASTPEQEPVNVKRLWSQVAIRAGLREESRASRLVNRLKGLVVGEVKDWRFLTGPSPALRYALVAALVVIVPLLVTRWVGWFPWNLGTPQLITVQISQAERNRIAFPDGSSVILDAGTTLRYPKRFTRRTREIHLDGEGFFEVVADSRKPFIIHASDALIQVLGTKFNVRAWEPDERVQVTVAEGHVSFRPMSTPLEAGVIIHEGEGSLMRMNGQPTKPVEVDVDEYLGWMRNEAVFRDVPLREVLFQVERWYDLSFDLVVPTVAGERVTMHIRRNSSVEDVLELISVLAGLPYTRDGRRILLGGSVPQSEGNGSR